MTDNIGDIKYDGDFFCNCCGRPSVGNGHRYLGSGFLYCDECFEKGKNTMTMNEPKALPTSFELNKRNETLKRIHLALKLSLDALKLVDEATILHDFRLATPAHYNRAYVEGVLEMVTQMQRENDKAYGL